MQYSKKMLFTHNNMTEELEDEELDALFNHLEQFEPPVSLVESIMATVAQLPPILPTIHQLFREAYSICWCITHTRNTRRECARCIPGSHARKTQHDLTSRNSEGRRCLRPGTFYAI